MTERLRRGIRIVLVAAVCLLGFAVIYAGYRFATKSVTLTVVAGSVDGDAARLMSAIATRLAASQSPVRLKVIWGASANRAGESSALLFAIVRLDQLCLARRMTLRGLSPPQPVERPQTSELLS